jgi:transcriptional regulator with XRE-family HTH domain
MDGRSLIAWNLKRLRRHNKVPQERLAADAQVDRAYVSQIERKQGNPTIDVLDKLADALGVRLAEFFREPADGEKLPRSLQVGRKPTAKQKRGK